MAHLERKSALKSDRFLEFWRKGELPSNNIFQTINQPVQFHNFFAREERLDVLDQRMQAQHLPKDQYYWYRDLRRYGTVPHAGFGLGFERLLSYITGLHNVRDVIPFPRTLGSAHF